jgi:hypothetical protein
MAITNDEIITAPSPSGYLKNVVLPAAFTLIVGLLLTIAGYQTSDRDGQRVATDLFRDEWNASMAGAHGRIERTFNLTYDALRTMAMLPGVKRIDRYAKNFEGDPRLSVQQLYNGIASHVAVSEIYIVPKDIDPDQLDPVTGKNQEPITTFDEIIVGKRADHEDENESKLEEVEIFEYRQMKAQCQACC